MVCVWPASRASSWFTASTTISPAILEPSAFTTGAEIRHGPHHGDQKSTKSGTGERDMARASSAASTSCGLPLTSSFDSQAEHLEGAASASRLNASQTPQRNVGMAIL